MPITTEKLRALDFDTGAMLRRLTEWVECESPTWDRAAVNRMIDLASFDLAALGASLTRIPGKLGFSDSVYANLPHPRRSEAGILILGHMDTVHPVGTLKMLPCRREGDICYGPGIVDMKSGNLLSLEAIRQLQSAGHETPLPVSVLFTGDEEVGSPSTSALIQSVASRHRYVLVPEPARPNGTIVLGRLEILRFTLRAEGRPSHAGFVPEQGQSAIRHMAEKIVAIENLSGQQANFNVGIVNGGQWSNCVPTTCEAEVLVLVKDQACTSAVVAALMQFESHDNHLHFTVTPGPARPLWQPDARCVQLYEVAKGIANELDMPLDRAVSGGGSDGNFTGALGIPTLDGLGARGQLHHTLQEHIFVDSLAERARLLAGLLGRLG
jgi:glutamate carboxypeptidase